MPTRPKLKHPSNCRKAGGAAQPGVVSGCGGLSGCVKSPIDSDNEREPVMFLLPPQPKCVEHVVSFIDQMRLNKPSANGRDDSEVNEVIWLSIKPPTLSPWQVHRICCHDFSA